MNRLYKTLESVLYLPQSGKRWAKLMCEQYIKQYKMVFFIVRLLVTKKMLASYSNTDGL